MHFEDIKRFIAEKGYRTKSEIVAQFLNENKELLESNLKFLESKNQVRFVKFSIMDKIDLLYYIPA